MNIFGLLKRERRGLTLIELILATILLAMIVLTVGGLSLSSRQALFWSRNKGRASSKAGIGMDHMVRNLRLANEVRIEYPGPAMILELVAWIDRANTPGDPTDDAEIRYMVHSAPERSSLRYRDLQEGIEYDIVWGVTRFYPEFDNTFEKEPFYLTIELDFKGDPLSPVDPKKNPKVKLRSGVNARCTDRVTGLHK